MVNRPLPKKYHWIRKFLKDLDKKIDSINNTMVCGGPGRGKFHHHCWRMETGIQLGKVKAWFVWIPNFSHLREHLQFLFQNDIDKKLFPNPDFQPRRFKVRIFVPISEYAPKLIPENLIVPFTVSVDNFGTDTIAMLCGNLDPIYYDEYDKIGYNGMSFTNFKENITRNRVSGHIIKKGFQGVRMLSAGKGNSTVLNHLLRRISEFEKEGMISNTLNKYSLEKWLEKEVYHQDTIVLLYTGFIKNNNLRKIVTVYFVETLRKITERQLANNPEIKFKHCIHFNEFEDFSIPQTNRASTVLDWVINQRMVNLISLSRHFNLEVHIDLKGFTYVEPKIEGMISTKYYLGLESDSEINRLTLISGFGAKELKNVTQDWYNRGLYRFIDLNEKKVPVWERRDGKTEYGYEFPRPRLCIHKKVSMKQDSFLRMNGLSTKEYLNTNIVDMNLLKKELAKEMQINEDKLIEKYEQREKEESLRQSNDELKKNNLKIVENLLRLNSNYKISELAQITGLNERTISRYKKELKEKEVLLEIKV